MPRLKNVQKAHGLKAPTDVEHLTDMHVFDLKSYHIIHTVSLSQLVSKVHRYYSAHDATKIQGNRRKDKYFKNLPTCQLDLLSPWNNLPSIKEHETK